jgi:catechol 1,2-dioxygenase
VDARQKRSVADVLLDQVLASFAGTPDERLSEIMGALVRHLHAFAREVDLSGEERSAAVAFLTAVGHTCTDTRQEFELLSDMLGLSSLVETSTTGQGATLQTLTGPFYSAGAPWRELGASMNEYPLPDDVPATLHGVVKNRDGDPIEGAILDVWQNATNRLYAVQDSAQPPGNLRGRWRTGPDGRYRFVTVRPVSYAIPDDGPVGDLLERTGRHPWRAAHIHFLVTADRYRPLTTEIFDAESDYLDDDAVFGVADDLIIAFNPRTGGEVEAEFDFTLEPSQG